LFRRGVAGLDSGELDEAGAPGNLIAQLLRFVRGADDDDSENHLGVGRAGLDCVRDVGPQSKAQDPDSERDGGKPSDHPRPGTMAIGQSRLERGGRWNRWKH
jgi:hypothetical protein